MKRWGVVVGIFLLAALLRLYNLDLRPFHHDEGVNFHFIRELFQRGYYPYSHENYHGPLFFYGQALFVWMFGEQESAFRLFTALTGIGLVFVPFCSDTITPRARIFASLGLAISASLVFYARYTIHETLFLVLQLIFALLFWNWIRKPQLWTMCGMALAVAGLIATKETFPLALIWIVLALISVEGIRLPWNQLRNHLSDIAGAYLLGAFALVATFTGLFQWSSGVREMLQAIPQWIGRGTKSDTGHFKPFDYYIGKVIWRTEYFYYVVVIVALVLLMLGIRKALQARKLSEADKPMVFFLIWSVGALLTYSAIPYKTPWLVMNATVPGVMLAGVVIDYLLTRFPRARMGIVAFGGFLFFGQLRETIHYNFRSPPWLEQMLFFHSEPFSDENPFIYVHTTQGMVDLVRDIRVYQAKYPGAKVVVGVGGHWPMPYYLRDYNPQPAYVIVDDPGKYSNEFDIIIADEPTKWESPEFEKKYYRLNGAQESYTFFRKRDVEPVEVSQ